MRVLMVLNELSFGGAETAALSLVRALTARGYEFSVAAMRAGGELRDAFASTGAEVVDGLAERRFSPRAPFRLARLVRRRNVEAMILVDVPRNATFHGAAGALASCRRIIRLCWCHSTPAGQGGDFSRRLRTHLAIGSLDAVVCVSGAQRSALVKRRIRRGRMPLIPNGVDLARFDGLRPARMPLDVPVDKRAIVQVANVMPDKDHATLLGATELLAGRRGDFRLVLVGRGVDSPVMRRQVDDLGLADVVTLAGSRNDVPEILGGADIFVLSTRSEVCSIATLEAMAAGVPVVVSDIPAFDGMVVHGRNGLRALPADPAALAGAMARLLDDDALRERLSLAGRVCAERFSLERMADRFDRLLRRLARARRRNHLP